MNETLNAVRRGEIWVVRNPSSIGREVCKDRPAVIVSADGVNSSGEGTVIVAWLSESEQHMQEPWTTRVVCSGNESRAICHKLTTVDQLRLLRRIGEVTPEEMGQIDGCIRASLGLTGLSVGVAMPAEIEQLRQKVELATDCNRMLSARLTTTERSLDLKRGELKLMENTSQNYWAVIELLAEKMMEK